VLQAAQGCESVQCPSVPFRIVESADFSLIKKPGLLPIYKATWIEFFWQGLHTMIWPSLCYTLGVSFISEAAAAGITKKL